MYQINVTPAGYDFHPDREIKGSALLKLMQLAATMDTAQFGMGYDDLMEDGLAFVSYKTVLEICGTLPSETSLSVKTWNRPKRSVKYVRDYIATVGENVVARSTTEWAMMNFKKRALAKPDEIKKSMEEIEEDVGLEVFGRIVPDESTLFSECERRPGYSELDINGHLNNTEYLDLCEDVSPFDFDEYRVSTVWMVYKREIRKDTLMDIKVYKNQSDYIVEVFDKKSGEMLFQSQIFLLKK